MDIRNQTSVRFVYDKQNHTYMVDTPHESNAAGHYTELNLFQGLVIGAENDVLYVHPDLARDIPGFYLKIQVYDPLSGKFEQLPGRRMNSSRIAVTGRLIGIGDKHETYQCYTLHHRKIQNGRGYFWKLEWN